jgi:23S rRNA (guanosine2251-2'-O)-methyltransferase
MRDSNLIFGFHAAEEALRDPRRVNQIWTSSGHRNARLKGLLEDAHQKRIPIKIVDRQALTRLAGGPHHQDLVLDISPYRYVDPDDLLNEVKDDSIFCILDEIQDATNLGTLIRTMEGAGVQGAFLPERRSASITAATHKLSAGALHHVKVARVVNLANLIDEMHEKGIRIICADASAEKVWYDADYSGPIAILVGNEQKGVRRLLKEKSDELVRIPMLGKLQSLNVNIAAAILLYEAIRQRQ